jgi:small subunit ribosomal protein S4
LEYDADNVQGKVVSYPEREQVDIPVREQLVVELYSR